MKHTPTPWKYHSGQPCKILSEEWFLARLKNRTWAALKKLPDGHTYDFTTADENHFKKNWVIGWVQLPTSEFVPLDCDCRNIHDELLEAAKLAQITFSRLVDEGILNEAYRITMDTLDEAIAKAEDK